MGYPSPSAFLKKYVVFFGGLAVWHGIRVMVDAVNHADWPDDVHMVVIVDASCLPATGGGGNPKLHVGQASVQGHPGLCRPGPGGSGTPISNPGGRSDTGLGFVKAV